MHFTKMHGIGNDYVYVNGFEEHIEDPSAAAIRVSDRHKGIGSDGLILINPSKCADFEMAMYNADGSRGKMCGNGIRCVGKYVYDHGLTTKKEITVETLGGIKTLELFTGEDGLVERVRVDMGEPVLAPEEIPVRLPGERVQAFPAEIAGRNWELTCVSMGNPHCVCFISEDVRDFPLEKIGPVFEHHELFPDRVNTEFVNILDRGRVRMRVWERGSGETEACGTGACAVTAAAILNGFTDRQVTVVLNGGELEIEWSSEDGHIYMTGPAEEVFEGEILL